MNDDVAIEYDYRTESRDTDAAWAVNIPHGNVHKLIWLPKSCCRLYDKSNVVYVPRWLAEKKGLI